jgi:inhibitor of cysteine peptidase
LVLSSSIVPSFAAVKGATSKVAVTVVKATPKPTPTKEVSQTITVEGTIKVSLNQSRYLTLVTEKKELYSLIGAISGLEKYVDKNVAVTGVIRKDTISAGQPGVLLEVKSFKIIATPPTTIVKPTSVQDKILGTVKVVKSETGFSFSLITTDISYSLTGNTKGMELLDGAQVVVYGTYSMLKIYPPIFIVDSYSVVSKPTVPTTPTATPLTVLKGTLDVSKLEDPASDIGVSYIISLKTQDGLLYTLNGKIEGMEKYNGYLVEVAGTVSMLKIYPPIFVVESYKVIVEPTVTPNYDVMQGSLKVVENITDKSADSLVPAPQYKYLLSTKGGVYELIGSTRGLEKYNGMIVEVKGNYVMTLLPVETPMFSVVSYRLISEPTPTSTPIYDVLQGTLKLVEIMTPQSSKQPYQYQLSTKNGVYQLIGNTSGLEKYNGMIVEIKGSYVMTLLPILPTELPLFNVVSYNLVAPTPTPIPAPSGTVHNVISDKPLYSWGPVDGDVRVIDGKCIISWMEGTNNAVFKAKLTVLKDIQKADYEYELVAAKTSDKESIIGVFNIRKDGVVIAKEIPGKVYGIGGPVGQYFKFYSEDTNWHLSAYITSRVDF